MRMISSNSRRGIGVATVAAALALTGCGVETVHVSGTVLGKEFTPSYCDTVMIPVPQPSGGMAMHPDTTCHPDTYEIRFARTDGSEDTVSVPQSVYDSVAEDQPFDVTFERNTVKVTD